MKLSREQQTKRDAAILAWWEANKGQGARRCAELLGVSHMTVYRVLRRAGKVSPPKPWQFKPTTFPKKKVTTPETWE